MISERVKPTFVDADGEKYYYFLKPCITKKGKIACHLFIFDEHGLLDECRYFLSKTYMKLLGTQLERKPTAKGAPYKPPYFCYYDILPNGTERYPKAQYTPLVKGVPLGTEDDEHLTVDRLYQFEMMLQPRKRKRKEGN